MVSAIAYIHEFNSMHRDVKPENMLLQKLEEGEKQGKGIKK
jgi:serine/threonine protein kinase